jgi:zinc/manganese transport system substrate-binding protein
MLKVSRADLLITVGLELEIGWIRSLVQGARNPKVNQGQKGYLELGPQMDPLEVAKGQVSRAQGDVHPDGNPHFWLDPIRLGRAAVLIGGRMGELDPSHRADFERRAQSFADRMKTKTAEWKKRIEKSGVKKIVTYHKTLTYLFDRFGLENPAYVEPKPGIPPTSRHLIEVIQTMKQQKVSLILVENFFDASITKKLTNDVPNARTESVAVSVGGTDEIKTNDDLYEHLVKAIEGK